MDDQQTDRRGGEGVGPKQVFSSGSDVLMEQGDRLRPLKVGCLAWLTYKIGCLLILLALILFVGLIAKFFGPPPDKLQNIAPAQNDTTGKK